MTDERPFASLVGDWLKATDVPLPDADANVRAAVARARAAGHKRAWLPRLRPRSRGHSAEGSPLVLASALALALALVVGAVAFLLLLGDGDQPRPPAATPLAVSGPDGLQWRTDRIDLRAKGLRLALGDRVFSGVGVPMQIESWGGDSALTVSWTEGGTPVSIELRAGIAGAGYVHWWIEELVAEVDGRTYRAVGPFFPNPWGGTQTGDVSLTLFGDDGEASLALDGLELTMAPPAPEPWWEGARFFGIPIPDFLGPLLPEPEGEAERLAAAEALREHTWSGHVGRGWSPGLAGGTVLDRGVVRITSDGAGNDVSDVVDIAVAPGGTIWVAGSDHVFELGVFDSRVPLDERMGTVSRIEATTERGLVVHGNGAWQLLDGAWVELDEADLAELAIHDTTPAALAHLEGTVPTGFVVDGLDGNGTVWGHGEELDAVLAIFRDAPLAVLDPSVTVTIGELTLSGALLEQGVVRVTGDAGEPLVGVSDVLVDDDGTVWVARGYELLALGRPERYRTDDGEWDWVRDLRMGADGSVIVGETGRWRLDDGSLREVPVPSGLGLRRVGVDADGTFWGQKARMRARWDGDGWIVYELADLFPTLSDAELDGLRGLPRLDGHGRWVVALPLGLASWFDGEEWRAVDLDAAQIFADPLAELQEYRITEDDALWLIAGTEDRPFGHLARFADGEWSSYRTDDLARQAGLAGDLQLAYPPWPLPDGRSLILAIGQDDGGEVQTAFDGETVTLMPPRPSDFQWMATSPDGSIWGTSRGELLVIPAVAPVAD